MAISALLTPSFGKIGLADETDQRLDQWRDELTCSSLAKSIDESKYLFHLCYL
jgi:hypothetical protein